MANLLNNLFSGNFFDDLSGTVAETVEDIVETLEDVTEETFDDISDDVEDAVERAVETAEDVVDSVDRFIDQNQSAFEELGDISLPNFSGVTLPRFDAPADIVQFPSAIFDFVRDLTDVGFPDLTLPTLPLLDLSGLGWGRDSIDLNLDLDLNRAVVNVQQNVREALDSGEAIVEDIEELAGDIVAAVEDSDGEGVEAVVDAIADTVVDAVEGFIEEDPTDVTQGVEEVFDIVDGVIEGVEDVSGETTVAGFIGGVFDIVSGIAQGVENIIGTETGVPEVVDDIGEFTTELTAQIEEREIATFSFLEDVIDLSDEVGDFLDDFDELADSAIANFEATNVGVNLEIDRDLLISIGDVAVEISDTIREIGGGVLLTENHFDALTVDSSEPAVLFATVTATLPETAEAQQSTQLLASATLMFDSDIFAIEADAAVL